MTMDLNERKKRHLEKLSLTRKQLVTAMRQFENGNLAAVGQILNEAIVATAETADAVASEYRACLLEGKLRETPPVPTQAEQPVAEAELKKRLADVDRNLGTLRQEIQLNYVRRGTLAHVFRGLRSVGTRRSVIAAAAVLAIAVPLRLMPSKTGLTGTYFQGANLETKYTQRVDKVIDFIWGYSSPYARIGRDLFSVRWSGYLRVPADGQYDFNVRADDGARFFIGNFLLVDNWHWQSLTDNRATVKLQKGYYPIVLEYFEYKKTAMVSLSWKSEFDAAEEIIPTAYLVPRKDLLKSDLPLRVVDPANVVKAAIVQNGK